MHLKFIKDILGGSFNIIEAINSAYIIRNQENQKYVFKTYSQVINFKREVYLLKLLGESEFKCPTILDYGTTRDNLFWIICNYMPGEPLSNIKIKDLDSEFFYILGHQISLLHNSINHSTIFKESISKKDYLSSRYKAFLNNTSRFIRKTRTIAGRNQLNHKKICQFVKNNISLYENAQNIKFAHNDLNLNNIVVERIKNKIVLSSIIDFEYCFFENIYFDFQSFMPFFLDSQTFEKQFHIGYFKSNDNKNTNFKNNMIFYFFRNILETMVVTKREDVMTNHKTHIKRIFEMLDSNR
jgi:tRNA A-37 threonylcarbamoyl transferase component Bud32